MLLKQVFHWSMFLAMMGLVILEFAHPRGRGFGPEMVYSMLFGAFFLGNALHAGQETR